MSTEPESAGGARLSKQRMIIGGAAVVAALVGVYAITHSGDEEQRAAAEASDVQAVSVVAVEEREFERRLALSGLVQPRREVRVYSPSTGVRALQMLVDEGDYVRAGQPLARLDSALAEAQTASAAAAVKEAEVDAQRAAAEYRRAESVRGSGALSDEAIETRRAAADAAQARLGAARAQLSEVQARLQGGYVRAPAAGLVIDRAAEAGQLVDGQLLFRIAADNALDVAVQVSESEMLALNEGQSARFSMLDGTEVRARLRRLPAALDPQTRTGEALYALPGNAKLRAGMLLRGNAVLPAAPGPAVPATAVLFDDREAYVFVVDSENVARRTPVALGIRTGDLIAVESGLTIGQRVAAAGAAFLRDGDRVRPVEALRGGQSVEPAAAAAAAALRSGG